MDDGSYWRTLLTVQAQSDNSSLGVQILVILILILVNGFFAAAEMSVVTINSNNIRKSAESGNRKAKLLLHFIENQGNFLATIQIGVTFAGFLSAAFGAETLAPYLKAWLDPSGSRPWLHGLSTVLITLFISFLSLVFGELIPKRIGMAYPEKFAMAFASLLKFFDTVFKPFTKLLNVTVDFFARLLKLDEKSSDDSITEEEIRLLTEVGRAKGTILGEEATMISNVFEFDDKSVSEIMTPRTSVLALDVESSWEETLEVVSSAKFSRLPVYEGDIDNIIGITHLKDFFRKLPSENPDFTLRDYLHPAYFVPETKLVNNLLREMRQNHITMAIVIDEYGGVDGIITMEDVLEELVGDIEDEYDEKYIPVIDNKDGTYIIDALLTPEEAGRFIKEIDDMEEDDSYDTMAGFVLSYLKRIPEENEQPEILIDNLRFKVLEMDDRRIAKLLVEVLADDETVLTDEGEQDTDDAADGAKYVRP